MEKTTILLYDNVVLGEKVLMFLDQFLISQEKVKTIGKI